MVLEYRTRITRLIVYGLLAGLLGMAIHVYVVYPLYVNKIPYFIEAVGTSLAIKCQGEKTSQLRSIIRYAGLPFFALDNHIIYIDKVGGRSKCWTIDDNSGETSQTFPLASMTKVLTAFITLDLLKRNDSLTLDTKLLDFFPEIDRESIHDIRLRTVDVEKLLSHSSGFGGPFGSDNMVERGVQPWCPYDLSALKSVTLAGEPGENYVYSNVAYCLLGEIISRQNNMKYIDYVEKEYLEDYQSLNFLTKKFDSEQPKYDYSNEDRFGPDYVKWLDLNALAPAAGLAGDPSEFAELMRSLYVKNPEILTLPRVFGCDSPEIKRCYSTTLVIHNLDSGEKIGVQQGYLPGASSLLAISSGGEVLVWTSAGAPLEQKYRSVLENRVIAFFEDKQI